MTEQNDEIGLKKIKTITGLLSCTYAEAIYKLHKQLETQGNAAVLPSPLSIASVLRVIYDRETTTQVFDDLKRGMVL